MRGKRKNAINLEGSGEMKRQEREKDQRSSGEMKM